MRRSPLSLALAALAALVVAAPAQGAFGLNEFDVTFTDAGGFSSLQAGSHPFAMKTSFNVNGEPTGEGGTLLDERPKDLFFAQVAGFVGNPTAVPRCSTADFLTKFSLQFTEEGAIDVPDCPDSAAVGITAIELASKTGEAPIWSAVYNLEPPPGAPARLGFWTGGVPVSIDVGVSESPPHNVLAAVTNISQILEVIGSEFVLWGVPADPAHDPLRGRCLKAVGGSAGECPANVAEEPFLTLPRACRGPLASRFEADSWANPGKWVAGSALTHDDAGNPAGMSGCGKLGFGPEVSVRPTTRAAESSSGLEIAIDVSDEGLRNPEGIAQADIEETVFALPAGMTANPSAAEGLGVCSKAQYEAESLAVRGCPQAAKLGTLETDTPILENHTLKGSVYLAAQDDPATPQPGAENPFDSLLAAYLVVRDPGLGVFAKLAAEIEADPETGRLLTTVRDIPPFPYSRIEVHLRSGPRAPLITPPACGPHATAAVLTPSSGAAPLSVSPGFAIDSGPGGAPCPPGGVLPFDPGFEAGAANGAAGAYSPFAMRITRPDGAQDLTRFSAVLPPGVVGRIAGVGRCGDPQIAAAKARSGRQEQAAPSCPASSRIGGLLAGAGVGTALTYVPGSLYLAGPYKGAPLSVAAIVPAVAGPFDVGTVVTRVALKLNPITAQVEVDGSRSDPIPHILAGIPLKVRDIRVHADRPEFTLNATSCEPMATAATLFGSFANPFDPADDVPVGRSARYQAASCASLAFRPRLAIKLKGGTRRGAHPALKAIVTPRPGQANFARAAVTLPRSAFLDQAHIRTICTRVQFAADGGNGAGCPKASIYGRASAWTPLLDEPARGPVFLRSSNNNLPDLVIALQGPPQAPFQVELSSRIDSVRGGIRSSFTGIPDLPVSRFLLEMQGGKKGLIVNSRNLCLKLKRNRARSNLAGQNGRRSKTRPVVRAVGCGKGRKGKAKHGRAGTR